MSMIKYTTEGIVNTLKMPKHSATLKYNTQTGLKNSSCRYGV